MTLAVRSSVEALAQQLRDEILEGKLAAGQSIRQEEMSARFGVSRSPLREALRQLEAEGMIEYRPNRGAVVASMDEQTVRHVYQFRRIVEPGAIELVVANRSDRLLADFRKLDAALRSATELPELIRTHHQFHQAIYDASGNPLLAKAIKDHHIRAVQIPGVSRMMKAVKACSKTDHARLLDALAVGSAKRAREATLEHLDHLEAIVLESLASMAS
jgi:DNA-binding GntR family transcriptional regulator